MSGFPGSTQVGGTAGRGGASDRVPLARYTPRAAFAVLGLTPMTRADQR